MMNSMEKYITLTKGVTSYPSDGLLIVGIENLDHMVLDDLKSSCINIGN